MQDPSAHQHWNANARGYVGGRGTAGWMWRGRWWSVNEKGGAVVSGVEAGFFCESEDLGKKWAARRRDEVSKVVRRGGRGVQREKTHGGGAKGLGALFARPVHMGVVLHARR